METAELQFLYQESNPAFQRDLNWGDGEVEKGTTFESAVGCAIDIIGKDRDKAALKRYITTGCDLMRSVFEIRFRDAEIKPIYHNISHAEWTLVHMLRIYAGKVASGEKQFDLYEFKLRVIVSLLHEYAAGEWWNRMADKNIRAEIREKVDNFVLNHNVKLEDICRVLVLDDFNLGVDVLVRWNLFEEGDNELDLKPPVPAFDGVNVRLTSEERRREGYPQMLAEIGGDLGGADFAQALHDVYLREHEVSVASEWGRINLVRTNLGTVILFLEVMQMRPNVARMFGWVEDERIVWAKVGCSKEFYENHFWPNLAPVLTALDAFYNARDMENPYRAQLAQLAEMVKLNDFNVIAYERLEKPLMRAIQAAAGKK